MDDPTHAQPDSPPVPRGRLPLAGLYTRLLQLKKSQPALGNGLQGGSLEWLPSGNEAVLAFRRQRGARQVTVTVNLSALQQSGAGQRLPAWGWHIDTH